MTILVVCLGLLLGATFAPYFGVEGMDRPRMRKQAELMDRYWKRFHKGPIAFDDLDSSGAIRMVYSRQCVACGHGISVRTMSTKLQGLWLEANTLI